MTKPGIDKRKSATNLFEKSIQEALHIARKEEELRKASFGETDTFGKASRSIIEEARRAAFSSLNATSQADEIAKQLGILGLSQAALHTAPELGLSQFNELVRTEEEARRTALPSLSETTSQASEFAKQLGLPGAPQLATQTTSELSLSQFGKLIRAEEELRRNAFSNLGLNHTSEFAKLAEMSEISPVSRIEESRRTAFSQFCSTSQASEFAKQLGLPGAPQLATQTTSELSLSQFGKLIRAEEELRRNAFSNLGLNHTSEFAKLAEMSEISPVSRIEESRRTAFSQFCSTSQADEIAKQLGILGAPSISRIEEEAREIALSNLGLGRQIDEVIQWKESYGSWVEDEEITELVDNLSGENPDFDKADEWLESVRDELTSETLSTIIKNAMERGVSDYILKLENKRHAVSRAQREKIREVWASGKYSSRNICANEEWEDIKFKSESTARNALDNTPDPSPWPAKEK